MSEDVDDFLCEDVSWGGAFCFCFLFLSKFLLFAFSFRCLDLGVVNSGGSEADPTGP